MRIKRKALPGIQARGARTGQRFIRTLPEGGGIRFPAAEVVTNSIFTGLEERELVDGLQAGNESAFRELIRAHQRRVYSTCLNILQHPEDAEDITQEVFIEVYESIHRFRGGSKLSTWLYRVATTKCFDHLRSKKRKKRFGIVLSLFGTESNEPLYEQSSFDHPGVALEKKEQARTVFAAISRLPENQRVAFTLHKIEDLSYKEVAEAMNVSLASVESLLFRAKQNLQKLLEPPKKKTP